MFNYSIRKELFKFVPKLRSIEHKIHTSILLAGKEEETIEAIIKACANAITSAESLVSTTRRLGNHLFNLCQSEEQEQEKDASYIRAGIYGLNLAALAGIIDVEKMPTIDSDKVKDKWYVISISEEFSRYAQELSPSSSIISPLNGAFEWVKPTASFNGRIIPIVKKSSRYNLTGLYTYDKMPQVYSAINRLNAQTFSINRSMIPLLSTSLSFIPEAISDDRRRHSVHSINDISRKARFIQEIRFKEMNKWLIDETDIDPSKSKLISKKRANEKSQDYYDTAVEEHLKVISAWSKRLDYEKIVTLVHEWDYQPINFIFNMCTRGRIYALQNYLSPLGSDLAKSMLLFNKEYQVSGYDLCVHVANCYGKDKLSFEDRVQWVNDNSEKIALVGQDPVANYSVLEELELHKEKKTKWQGIAASQVYSQFVKYIQEYDTEEGFTTALIIGLDSTSSGTQILTILGRDDKVAPYVNVSESTTGRVGDFYTFLAGYLKPKLEARRSESETLDAILNHWSSYARDLAKRNSMTFSYSGTKFGFGEQHWQDRHDYNKGSEDKTGSNLTRSDCRIIGNSMYEVCEENIKGGAEIMKWLRDGITAKIDSSIITWTMPDGFTAFQVADKSKAAMVEGIIGTRQISIKYYVFQDKPDTRAHKNGIAPNFIHSYDSYMLRLIVLGMPDEAPISTVHDMFSTCSYYIEELQSSAKNAYKTIADREVAANVCEDAFKIYRELPIVGTWEVDEIDKAEFIIC